MGIAALQYPHATLKDANIRAVKPYLLALFTEILYVGFIIRFSCIKEECYSTTMISVTGIH